MIHVLAFVDLHPGKRDAWMKEFAKVVPAVHAEDGCLAYEATVDADPPHPRATAVGGDAVVIVERWRDMAALIAHGNAPHMGTYRAATKDFVKGMTLRVLSPA